MKGVILKKWGCDQSAFYGFNWDTREKIYYTRKTWLKATIKFLLDMSLGIWYPRYKIMHRRTWEEQRKRKRDNTFLKVQRCFTQKKMVYTGYEHLFAGDLEDLKRKGNQDLKRWVASFEATVTQTRRLKRQRII